MDNQDNSINNDHHNDKNEEMIPSMTAIGEGDTYPISDSESTTDVMPLIDTNVIQDEEQGELNHSMSQDSLTNDEQDHNEKLQQTSSITIMNSRMNSKLKSPTNGARSVNLDEHIKLVKQKKEEAEVLRLQRFQEQMRKKEQKWQQQHLEKVKKWLELRNRDIDHRSQVEERRKKREEETKVKIEEILRREKERQQRSNSQIKVNQRGNVSHRPDSIMSMSADIVSNRRAISVPRIRTNQHDMTNRRRSNDSPIPTISQDNSDNSTTVISSHQLNPIDERRSHHRSRHSYDATMTNEDNSLSGTSRTVAHSRTRPMPTSYTYWLNTGDNNNNNNNANFMRLTYAATCRSRLSRSVERCPRACRARDDLTNNTTTINGESQPRIQSINRQHLNETILRLSKPKTTPITQSIHSGTTTASASPTLNSMSVSQSGHQFRVSTPPTTTSNLSTPTSISSKTRRNIHSRPTTASSYQSSLNNDSRASPTVESTSEHHQISSSIRQSSQRTGTHPKFPLSSSSKPPTSLSSSRSKQPMQRSLMTTSHSSSSISSAAATTTTTPTNKKNIRRIGGVPPSKQKPKTEPISSIETPDNEILSKDNEILTKDNNEENLPVNEDTQEKEKEKEKEEKEEEKEKDDEEEQQQISTEIEPTTSVIEPINIDTVTEIINPTTTTTPSKREQQIIDEQEYQRKLNQKIREAQQRMELERQREEERQRQLELEEYEREQEQIRLVEEQRLAEKERLQRAIEEREREDELKRLEEQRLQQQREELERKQAEETERLNRERQERAKKEEEERNERKRRLDLIMRRTRQDSPSLKPENNISKTNIDETNGHDTQQSPMSHSISDNRLPIPVSNDNLLNNNDSTTPETSKFKSPLIQSLLNKARNTKSTDNLIQSNMTTSQIMNESMVDEEITTIESTTQSDLSDNDENDDDQQDSEISNITNGHSDSPLSSSTNLNSSHDRSIETATTLQ